MISGAGRSLLRTKQLLRPNSLVASVSSRRRLLSTLAVLEQRDGKLNHASLRTLTAAKSLGGHVHAFIAGSSVSAAAEEAAKVDGVEQITIVENEAYEKVVALPETYALLLKENVLKGNYTHVIAGHSAFGKNTLPRVAALLDSQQISDIISIENESTFVRPIYAGNAISTVESSDPVKVITIRGTAFGPPATGSGSAAIAKGSDVRAEQPSEWISEDLAKSDRPDLAQAGKVVSGGRGLKSKEEFDRIILPLADALGAAVGASRAAVDSGYADNALQVGQTGKVVAPQLYMAVGISGAIQHLAGMKDSKTIAAINKDADAPIFQVADVGLVGDLFEKVPELTEKLKNSLSQQ
ncbi:hypothetical protein L249_5350 [Ophiocordyceps polyrhachis-furcata BCC 54312]|uniref:Probable electron transfer flavoprotein subunit alpha n=1 Tax=Ophiocordyceps polyrhachis-furcata BCC 54312 TaxID=1330021 RepID=A0A367L980_9HYPO|nr:hypothetical protein L249_5350 [Ophiocordyceps polyrhachis-furcata BCC 54312]